MDYHWWSLETWSWSQWLQVSTLWILQRNGWVKFLYFNDFYLLHLQIKKTTKKRSEKCHKFEKIFNFEVRTIFYKQIRQNPQILKSRVLEILMKSQSRSFNQVSVSAVTVSTASLWITHFLLGHSYTEAKWGTCLDKLSVMLPQNIFAKLHQIMLYCVAVLKRAALQLHYVATTKDTTSLD